jgi:hypothetical protein
MAFDAKDRALLESSALVGYAQSARDITDCDKPQLEKWVEGLLRYADKSAKAIDSAHEPARGPVEEVA